ncbi:hypothetical protein [Undibacter mobilis]|uniref:hypothetical protein n=1 Tax=Undibacter mobilis TaxID=2292256 RepID=UPI0011C0623B|nr:hypothetical protein [Undibacter mobilis]
MRALILSSLFALGLGLAGATSASAAPIADINAAVAGQAMVDHVQYYRPRYRHRVRCHNVRVCRMTPWGRRCHYERVCRRW